MQYCFKLYSEIDHQSCGKLAAVTVAFVGELFEQCIEDFEHTSCGAQYLRLLERWWACQLQQPLSEHLLAWKYCIDDTPTSCQRIVVNKKTSITCLHLSPMRINDQPSEG